MSKAQKKPDTLRVWHPVYKAEAHPKREDLQAWIDKGWQEQPETKETDK